MTVDGFDLDESSIEMARQNAREAGLSDRVTYRARDVAEAEPGQYDVGVIIEAVHDMAQPVAVLSSLRRMLRPDGVVLVADEKTADAFTAPADELDRLYYGFSVFTCLPAAMTERPTEALGTVTSVVFGGLASLGVVGFVTARVPQLRKLGKIESGA